MNSAGANKTKQNQQPQKKQLPRKVKLKLGGLGSLKKRQPGPSYPGARVQFGLVWIFAPADTDLAL